MNILVVDDNSVILNNLNGLLSQQGYFVSTAAHGLAATEMLQSNDFDLIIVDHLMPIMNGIKLTQHLRQNELYANAPIIFLTTQGQKSVASICDASLFTAIVDKPINTDNLLKLVNDLLTSNSRYQLL